MSGPVAALVAGLVELVAALTTPREPARELVDVVGRIGSGAGIENVDRSDQEVGAFTLSLDEWLRGRWPRFFGLGPHAGSPIVGTGSGPGLTVSPPTRSS